MFEFIFDAIDSLIDKIGRLVSWVINGILSLKKYVVDYFRGLKLRKGRDVPFIADSNKIANLIHQAPQKEVGIFEATYNEDTDEIENYRALEADKMDSNLKNVLGNEKLVVLQ